MSTRTFTLVELGEFGANSYEAHWTGESWDTRWNKYTNIVFKAKGKFYRTTYCEGLTEYQDCDGWDQYPDATYDTSTGKWSLTCPEVESYQRQVTVTEWRSVAA